MSTTIGMSTYDQNKFKLALLYTAHHQVTILSSLNTRSTFHINLYEGILLTILDLTTFKIYPLLNMAAKIPPPKGKAYITESVVLSPAINCKP